MTPLGGSEKKEEALQDITAAKRFALCFAGYVVRNRQNFSTYNDVTNMDMGLATSNVYRRFINFITISVVLPTMFS